MTDSDLRDRLDDKHERNQKLRLDAIRRWVEFIEEQPPEVWGPQQNKLVESQLQSARESGLDAEHYRRVREAGENPTE